MHRLPGTLGLSGSAAAHAALSSRWVLLLGQYRYLRLWWKHPWRDSRDAVMPSTGDNSAQHKVHGARFGSAPRQPGPSSPKEPSAWHVDAELARKLRPLCSCLRKEVFENAKPGGDGCCALLEIQTSNSFKGIRQAALDTSKSRKVFS